MSEEAAQFWRKYEFTHGERVHAFSLGRYIKGCADLAFPLWGLLIATDGGFRFHHFPQESWLTALSRATTGGGKEAPKEKTAFIPLEKIISIEYKIEKSWLKKIFLSAQPLFILRYYDDDGQEWELIAETDKRSLEVIEALQKITGTSGVNESGL